MPYTTVYKFSYADTVRGPTHRVLPPVEAPAPPVQAPQVPTPAPAQTPAPQVQALQVPAPPPAQAPTVQAPQVPTPAPAQTPAPQVQTTAPVVISEPRKSVQSESVSVVQSEPKIRDLQPLEDDSNPTSPNLQPIQHQPQLPDRLRDLLARTHLRHRVATGSFGAANLEAAEKFQAALRAKEQLAALLAKNRQIEEAKQAAYRERLASSSSSDSSAYNTPAGSPEAMPISKTKGKIKRNLDQVTNTLNFSFARDSRLTRSTFKKKEGTGWPPKSSN